ncbi:MAG: ribosome maturation factor RimP [Myxococcota bacterium]
MNQPSTKQSIEERAREVAEPIVAAEGYELVDLEYVREREGWVLRLFIDKPGGVGLEDCTNVSRAVETALDVEDVVPQEYHLEVSSPGLSRPLTKPDHFRRAEGKKIKVKTYGPIGEPPRKNFSGVLAGVADDGVTVEVEGAGAFRIPYKDIAKANLEFEF